VRKRKAIGFHVCMYVCMYGGWISVSVTRSFASHTRYVSMLYYVER
jgi:hypothetical protein